MLLGTNWCCIKQWQLLDIDFAGNYKASLFPIYSELDGAQSHVLQCATQTATCAVAGE
jgi:hypothetical protein